MNKAAAPLRAVHTAGSLRNITAESLPEPGEAASQRRLPAVPAGSAAAGQSAHHAGMGPQVHAGPADRCSGAGRVRHHHPDLGQHHPGPGPAGPDRRARTACRSGQQGRHRGDRPGARGTGRGAGRLHRRKGRALGHHHHLVLAATGIVAAAATVLADPLAAAQGSIAAATGVTGSSAGVATVFPVLAVVPVPCWRWARC